MDKIDKPGKAVATTCATVARWVRGQPYLVVAILVFAGIAYPLITRSYSEWDEVFVRAAKHLRAGDGIYHFGEGYVYPPFMALVAVPFSYLPKYFSLSAWYVVNVAATFLLCRYAWLLAGGTAHGFLSRAVNGKGENLIWLLGLACGIRYVFDGLSHQQTDIVIAALLMYGCWALLHSRSWSAATSFGLAAGAKCTPLLWCVYLLWRRQWREAAWLVAVAIGVNLLPNLLYRPAADDLHLVQWVERHLAPATVSSHYPYSEQIYNQSLAGAASRWFTTTLAWSGGELTIIDAVHSVGRISRQAILYGLELALLLVALGLCSRHPRGAPGEVWEYCLVLLLMVLVSPMSSKPHFCTLLLPGFCLARHALEKRDPGATFLLIAAVFAGAVGIRGLVGRDVSTLSLWYGNVMWSALALLVACAYRILRESYVAEPSVTLTYPLMTPTGRIRATFRDSPARCTTSTTSSTFL